MFSVCVGMKSCCVYEVVRDPYLLASRHGVMVVGGGGGGGGVCVCLGEGGGRHIRCANDVLRDPHL